ncbi:MAG: 5-formyltetrahydrofolate cyclo-ligase [Lentisphaerae bacterium]|nr:5-formyltetrahydrofolate cyclo-ligase [Lentisphaerota bacterium]
MRRLREALAPRGLAARSARAAARLVRLPVFHGARAVALYLAAPREPSTARILAACRRSGRRVAVPAWDAALRRYRFAWFPPRAATVAGPLGIPQPSHPRWVRGGALDLVVVPGLAFDRSGGRLGHGGGHYDALLGGRRAATIGFTLDAFLVPAVPMAPHDVAMDWLATESLAAPCGDPPPARSGAPRIPRRRPARPAVRTDRNPTHETNPGGRGSAGGETHGRLDQLLARAALRHPARPVRGIHAAHGPDADARRRRAARGLEGRRGGQERGRGDPPRGAGRRARGTRQSPRGL